MLWSSTFEGTRSPIDSGAPARAFGTFRSLSTISLIMKSCSVGRLTVGGAGETGGSLFACPSTSDTGANNCDGRDGHGSKERFLHVRHPIPAGIMAQAHLERDSH